MWFALQLGSLAIAALWFGRALRGCLALRRVPFLGTAVGGSRPTIAVVVVFRDAAADVAPTVDAVLRQTGVDVELIAVDDRSTDATAMELARRSADSRVHPIRVDAVPPGWLARWHAICTGAEQADAEWLLICPAPVAPLTADCLARAVAHAQAERAALLGLVPRERFGRGTPLRLGMWIDAIAEFATWNRGGRGLDLVDVPRLIRRDAWRLARPSDETLREHPLAIQKVETRLRASERRVRFAHATDELASLRPARLRDLDAPMFVALAVADHRPTAFIAAVLFTDLCWFAAWASPLLPTPLGWFACAGLAAQTVPAFDLARIHRLPVWAAVASVLVQPWGTIHFVRQLVAIRCSGVVVRDGHATSLDRLRAAVAVDEDAS